MPDRAKLERERLRLVLAESDMKQAAAATAHLAAHGAEMNGDAVRVMQTGVVVTYARSYVPSRHGKLGAIQGRLAKPENPALRPLHNELLERRSDLFAHNAATTWRDEIDFTSQLAMTGGRRFVESWVPVDPVAYPAIERLATAQRSRFQERLREVEKELGTLP